MPNGAVLWLLLFALSLSQAPRSQFPATPPSEHLERVNAISPSNLGTVLILYGRANISGRSSRQPLAGQKRAGTLGRGHHSCFRVFPDPCPGWPQAHPLSFSSPRCYSSINLMSYRNIMALAGLQWLHSRTWESHSGMGSPPKPRYKLQM
ncbi:hypothetical protein OH76DRAFT_864790 [Lentinus brumalis]|uniref:Uncharacterized protein n=1 Tax=Lentinus brumalis TaxID=2498619 RepID=A0A371DRC2_9APHY|nr:hypothetical protein OH76DRAFT_864790 [Polyporus brumalis]